MTREGHDDERGHELRPVQTGVGEVQDAVKELETAAWREGIDPGRPFRDVRPGAGSTAC